MIIRTTVFIRFYFYMSHNIMKFTKVPHLRAKLSYK